MSNCIGDDNVVVVVVVGDDDDNDDDDCDGEEEEEEEDMYHDHFNLFLLRVIFLSISLIKGRSFPGIKLFPL